MIDIPFAQLCRIRAFVAEQLMNTKFGKKKKEIKKLTLAKNMVMDVSATTVAFLSKDKNANV